MKTLLLAALVALTSSVAFGQELLSLSVSPGSISFDSGGAASEPISVTVTWNVNGTAGEHAWIVYPYFSSGTALSGQYGHSIPSRAFLASADGGSPTSCTGSGIYGGYSNPLSSTGNCPGIFYQDNSSLRFGAGIPDSGSQTSTVTVCITGVSTFNADNYRGTLNFIAYVE